MGGFGSIRCGPGRREGADHARGWSDRLEKESYGEDDVEGDVTRRKVLLAQWAQCRRSQESGGSDVYVVTYTPKVSFDGTRDPPMKRQGTPRLRW